MICYCNWLLLVVCINGAYSATCQWQQIKFNSGGSNNPPSLCGQQSVVMGNNGLLLMFGGCDSTCCSIPYLVLWTFNLNTYTWSVVQQTVNPQQRVYHSFTTDGSVIVLWGGVDQFVGMFLRDMWILKAPGYQWSQLNPNSAWPTPRGAHTGVLVVPAGAPDTEYWIYGGRDASNVYSELWRYSFAQNMWVLISSGDAEDGTEPGPRAFHSAVSYQVGGQSFMLVFGGTDGNSISLNDLWRYDFQIKDWAQIIPKSALPSPRVGHQALINNYGGNPYMWIFGGQGNQGELNDVWLFDITLSMWSSSSNVGSAVAPPRSYFSASALNGTTNVVYGGYISPKNTSSGAILSDMWLQTRIN